jgi:hypothetical protein
MLLQLISTLNCRKLASLGAESFHSNFSGLRGKQGVAAYGSAFHRNHPENRQK